MDYRMGNKAEQQVVPVFRLEEAVYLRTNPPTKTKNPHSQKIPIYHPPSTPLALRVFAWIFPAPPPYYSSQGTPETANETDMLAGVEKKLAQEAH